jgi:hypothetical protein
MTSVRLRKPFRFSYGERLNHLRIIGTPILAKPNKKLCVFCVCDCGKKILVNYYLISKRSIKSCGCVKEFIKTPGRKSKHGQSKLKTPTYRTWSSMLSRCNNKKNVSYQRYGGKGIQVCSAWLDFEQFFKDMGSKPKGMQIDRIDNNGGYSKENCRWVTPFENCCNRGITKKITYNNEEKSISEWGKIFCISPITIKNRLKDNWSVEKALKTPVRKQINNDTRNKFTKKLNYKKVNNCYD